MYAPFGSGALVSRRVDDSKKKAFEDRSEEIHRPEMRQRMWRLYRLWMPLQP
jgi:hypothetical protein